MDYRSFTTNGSMYCYKIVFEGIIKKAGLFLIFLILFFTIKFEYYFLKLKYNSKYTAVEIKKKYNAILNYQNFTTFEL